MLTEAGVKVVDFCDPRSIRKDDNPDFVLSLVRTVSAMQVECGLAICGNGVGACIFANKVPDVRASLIHDPFTAHQGVEEEDLNLICLSGQVVTSLTENGKSEAKALRAHLPGTPFCQVFTSPLNRARQTCELVALSPVAEIEPDFAE